MILKVQLSLFTTADRPRLLVYNKDRSVFWEGPLTKKLANVLGDAPKQFWVGDVKKAKVLLQKKAAWQSW